MGRSEQRLIMIISWQNMGKWNLFMCNKEMFSGESILAFQCIHTDSISHFEAVLSNMIATSHTWLLKI